MWTKDDIQRIEGDLDEVSHMTHRSDKPNTPYTLALKTLHDAIVTAYDKFETLLETPLSDDEERVIESREDLYPPLKN
jgi:hypothetical protein